MTPPDYRKAQFQDIQAAIAGRRLAVFVGLSRVGPCTTRELAERTGMDLLAVRPRVTELVQLGFAEVLPPEDPKHPGTEGRYRALSNDEALAVFETRQREAHQHGQLAFKLPV